MERFHYGVCHDHLQLLHSLGMTSELRFASVCTIADVRTQTHVLPRRCLHFGRATSGWVVVVVVVVMVAAVMVVAVAR